MRTAMCKPHEKKHRTRYDRNDSEESRSELSIRIDRIYQMPMLKRQMEKSPQSSHTAHHTKISARAHTPAPAPNQSIHFIYIADDANCLRFLGGQRAATRRMCVS